MRTVECWYVEPFSTPEEGVWYPEWDRSYRFSSFDEAMKYAKSLHGYSQNITTSSGDIDNVPVGQDFVAINYEKFTVFDDVAELANAVRDP